MHELEQDNAKLEATAQSKAGMSLAALENALADAMYANAAAGKINTEAYGLNRDEMASVMAATIKTYHLSSAVTDLGYETNAATRCDRRYLYRQLRYDLCDGVHDQQR